MEPIVIIGGGLAGYAVARAVRRRHREVPLLLITEDDGEFYSKPLLSTCFATSRRIDSLVEQPPAVFAEQLSLQLLSRTPVSRIDPDRHLIWTRDGALSYRSLVLAVGAVPLHLPLADGQDRLMYSVNDISGYRMFRQGLSKAKTVAIVGAGLVGCEFANDLARGGFAVTVIDVAPYPLVQLLPAPLGKAYGRQLEAKGISFELEQSLAAVRRNGSGLELRLSSDKSIQVDIALSAIGIKPRTALVQAAGIATGRGILVNRSLQTSARDVYALGDCTEYGRQWMPFVGPILRGAEALAETVLGNESAVDFSMMPISVKTPDCPVIGLPPPVGVTGQWCCERTAGGMRALYWDSKEVVRGFAAIAGEVKSARTLNSLISNQALWEAAA